MRVPDGTMFAGMHGELTLHPWRDPVTAESDVYSLFHSRSVAMGWLTEAREGATGGFWGMNDAGQHGPNPSALHPYALWFQVVLPRLVSPKQSLPLQPFLACIGDVIARMGRFQLDALQVLLPLQSFDRLAGASSRKEIMYASIGSNGWFFDGNPSAAARVQVVLDGGQSPVIRSVAAELFQRLQQVKQTVFLCDAFSLTDATNVLKPNFLDDFFKPSQHPVTLYGTLAEWSLDALGWLAAFLAGISFEHNITTPMVLTVSQFEG